MAEGLISAPTPDAAYKLVYHHYRQMLRATRGKEIVVEAERDLYVSRLERLLRKAMTRADGYDNDGSRTLSPMIQYLNLRLAMTLAEKIAAANCVATRPKIEANLNLSEKFDLVKEHARAVVEKQQLQAGKIIDIKTSTQAEESSRSNQA